MRRPLLVILMALLFVSSLGAYTVNYGVAAGFKVLGEAIKVQIATISTYLSPLVTLYGGGRAAWKAAHGEAFTKPLIFAIVGVALFAVASTDFTLKPDAIGDGLKGTAIIGASILGGLVALIGGSIAAWNASHGEAFTKPLVFAIVASAIAVATVLGVGQ